MKKLIALIILGVGLGISGMSLVDDITGDYSLKIMIGDVEISALAISTILAILLNLIIPSTKEEIELDIENIKTISLSQASGIEGLDVVKEERGDSLKEKNIDRKKKRFYWLSFEKKEEKDQK